MAIRVLSELLDTVREILWRLQALVINSVVVSSDSHSSRKTIWADMAQTTGPKWATPPLRLDSWRRPVRPEFCSSRSVSLCLLMPPLSLHPYEDLPRLVAHAIRVPTPPARFRRCMMHLTHPIASHPRLVSSLAHGISRGQLHLQADKSSPSDTMVLADSTCSSVTAAQ